MDNNGVIDMEEVTAIIETLDSIEGVKQGGTVEYMNKKGKLEISYPDPDPGTIFNDGGGNPHPIEDSRQRAFDVFKVFTINQNHIHLPDFILDCFSRSTRTWMEL